MPSPSRRYTNLGKLSDSWKGRSFRGRLGDREKDVVILEIAQSLASAPGFPDRFNTLGAALAALDHPGLVKYLEFRRTGDSFFIVSDFIEGERLRDWKARQSPSAAQAMEGICSALHALEHAHGKGIVHLDLTPEQILVDRSGGFVVTDLGLATLFGPEGRAARAGDSVSLRAMFPYMAPETHQPGARPDFRADVYSMGAIVYELLTGRVPVGLFDMPSQLEPGLDPRIDAIVATALAAEPTRRYQRAVELAAALEHVMSAPAARPVTPTPQSSAPSMPRGDASDIATLTLDSDPPGARITDLSGGVYGNTPLVLRLAPGSYTFTFRLPEPYLPITEEVTLIAGSSARIVARPPKRGGEMVVTSSPTGAEVLRAGQPVGTTPLTFPVGEGERGELVLRMAGYHDTAVKFEGRSAERTELRVPLKPRLAIVHIESDPVGCDVLDEKLVRISTAPARVHLEHGRRRLTFRSGKGYEERSVELELGPGEERTLSVELTPKPGLVEVTSVPSGAQVLRDGAPIGVTSMVLTLPGRQPIALTLQLPGYQELTMSVTAEGGARTVAEGRLELAQVEGLEFIGMNEAGFREYRNARDGSVLIFIPAGPFTRGSEKGDSDEQPVRTITLSGYYVGRVPVTNAQYSKFLAETRHRRPASYPGFDEPEHPVVGVDWNDAVAYCQWAGLRLPSEAEWEKAAKGLDDRTYPWGEQPPVDLIDELKERLGRRETPKLAAIGLWQKSTDAVGSHPSGASPFGCLDLAGNVWEWCLDWHDGQYYGVSPETDPPGPAKGNERICRGGAWSTQLLTWRTIWERAKASGSHRREAWRFHVPRISTSTRGWYQPGYRFNNLGFRVARSHP